MSSSIDWIKCPKCGNESASREQDNRNGDIHFSCKCGWRGEIIEEGGQRPSMYRKIIVGFVSQEFELKGGKYVCTSQEFVAGDDVSREDGYGEPVDIDDFDEPEDYFPMDMIQPE